MQLIKYNSRHCGGDHWRLMAAESYLNFQTWTCRGKTKSRENLFFPEVEKQVPRGLVFSRSGKNKSPGDLFFPEVEKTSPLGTCFFQKWKKQVPRGLVFSLLEKQHFFTSTTSTTSTSTTSTTSTCPPLHAHVLSQHPVTRPALPSSSS